MMVAILDCRLRSRDRHPDENQQLQQLLADMHAGLALHKNMHKLKIWENA